MTLRVISHIILLCPVLCDDSIGSTIGGAIWNAGGDIVQGLLDAGGVLLDGAFAAGDAPMDFLSDPEEGAFDSAVENAKGFLEKPNFPITRPQSKPVDAPTQTMKSGSTLSDHNTIELFVEGEPEPLRNSLEEDDCDEANSEASL